jgi:hypothetical protein
MDRKWGITTDGTHFLHAFPAKWGPHFGWSFYEAACLNGNETALPPLELGVKESTIEAWLEIVGKDVLDPVLRDTDGIRTTGIDDYKLSDLAAATISGANCPKAPDVLAQLTAVLNKAYDFRKKVAVNFESQQAAAAKVGSYGITIGVDMMVLALMANMDMAEQQAWGLEFHVPRCSPSARSTRTIMCMTTHRCKIF